MVMIQIFGQAGANEFVTVYLENSRYYRLNYQYAPKLKSVSPRAASSEEVVQLQVSTGVTGYKTTASYSSATGGAAGRQRHGGKRTRTHSAAREF